MGTGVDNGAPPPYSPPPGRPWNPHTPAPSWQDPAPQAPAQPWQEPEQRWQDPAPHWAQQPPAAQAPAPAAPPHLPGPRGHGSRGTRPARRPGRIPPAAAVSLVLGAGLLLGAGAGTLLGGGSPPAGGARFGAARDLWHDRDVDTLFPRTVHGPRSGPGDADRTWIRIGVAPDSTCSGAFDPPLAKALATAGCVRLLRATYTDATSTDVTTVGIVVTRATPAGQRALRAALAKGTATDPSAVPLPVAFPGTPAAGFGPGQRGSWSVRVSTRLPVVVYAVSGLADGRTLTPQAASAARKPSSGTVPAQAGLGFEADGLAAAVDRAFAATAGVPHPESTR